MKKIQFYGNPGENLRSSAIFYFRNDSQFTTTISFLNYWKIKRDIPVEILISLRSLTGELLKTENYNFDKGMVANITEKFFEGDVEGSLEIEAFSDVDLVIPYAAVMATYESRESLSLTHSYSRVYSKVEIEEGRTIMDGEEGCWTIRDTSETRSFCVFHNGSKELKNRTFQLQVTNSVGEKKHANIEIKKIKPFETVKIYPGRYIDDLASFLEGKEGYGNLKFETGNSFTRMLLVSESFNGDQIQTAHSNFNYSLKAQDNLSNENSGAVMKMPNFGLGDQSIIVYPDFPDGDYVFETASRIERVDRKSAVKQLKFVSNDDELRIKRIDTSFPSRLVTGFVADYRPGYLPIEVSRGIRHEAEPPKRFWWGPCAFNEKVKSKIILNPYTEFCDLSPLETEIVISLYSESANHHLETQVSGYSKDLFQYGASLDDLFDEDVTSFLSGSQGYFTMFSEFSSYDVLSLFIRADGAKGLEHCF